MAINETVAMGNLKGLGFLGGIFALFAGLFILSMIIAIGIYVFVSLAFMAMAKKAKQKNPGLAWIPGIGPAIICYNSSKMHWWPWLLLIGFFIPIVNFFAAIIFAVFVVIWRWKLMEEIKKPGWWSILMLIPIVNFILMGVAAWSKE